MKNKYNLGRVGVWGVTPASELVSATSLSLNEIQISEPLTAPFYLHFYFTRLLYDL